MNMFGSWGRLTAEPAESEDLTLETAVREYALVLETAEEFARFSNAPEHCYLSAFGISPPTGAELRAARQAVVDRINSPAPSRGLVSEGTS